ncbi:hypothetical protein [Burkholderia cepacia]|uniref:hypothetical protein n=1 Tax=Burkholderia cepacia TaxID=292 RepID=UPI001F2AFF1C|nr:hypothetical protein [Burkholderia cepacia]MCE4125805.1 hypothetical protein [Burkholderia cepacia]
MTTENSRADALTEITERLQALMALKKRTDSMPVMNEWQWLNNLRNRLLAASPVEQPATAPIDETKYTQADMERYGKAYADARDARRAAPSPTDERATFQQRVQPWMLACFGAEIAADRAERNHRFFEEAGELVQACGMTREEAHALVDYTWSRPVGEPTQEVGGVMVTLAALCLANGLDMHAAGETELARINVPETIAKIRAKQAAKPKHSPLPEAPRSPAMAAEAVAGLFVKRSKFGPWIEIEKPEPGAVTFYTAPQPAQADARVGLTNALIRKIATQYCEYDADGRSYNILRYECEEDFFNCVRELLAAHPGQPEPRAEVTDVQFGDQALAILEELVRMRYEKCRIVCQDNVSAVTFEAAKELLAARTGASS